MRCIKHFQSKCEGCKLPEAKTLLQQHFKAMHFGFHKRVYFTARQTCLLNRNIV